jgi:hypothetical protein
VKFQFAIDKSNTFYGISLRQSGLVDIYWNMTLIDSPPNGNLDAFSSILDYMKDVALSFDEIYLHMQDGDIRGIQV